MDKVNWVVRGFNTIDGFDEIARLPERSTKFSAGYDFFAIEHVTIEPGTARLVRTGIKAYMPGNEYLQISARSSAFKLHPGMILCNGIGIIDSDYYENPSNDGHIMFPYINLSSTPYSFYEGNKIGQGVFLRYNRVDQEETERERWGGFGSTGN